MYSASVEDRATHLLFLRSPANWAIVNQREVTSNQLPVTYVIGVVGVNENCDIYVAFVGFMRGHVSVVYVRVFGVFKVTHHLLRHLQVVFGRRLAVLSQESDRKSDVRLSPNHRIHQLTYNIAISGDVSKWCTVTRVVYVSPGNWHVYAVIVGHV